MEDIKLILMLLVGAVAFVHSVPPKDPLTSDGEGDERLSKRHPQEQVCTMGRKHDVNSVKLQLVIPELQELTGSQNYFVVAVVLVTLPQIFQCWSHQFIPLAPILFLSPLPPFFFLLFLVNPPQICKYVKFTNMRVGYPWYISSLFNLYVIILIDCNVDSHYVLLQYSTQFHFL